jgi:hypothetical protein
MWKLNARRAEECGDKKRKARELRKVESFIPVVEAGA